MANVDFAYGFRFTRSLNGNAQPSVNLYYIPASDSNVMYRGMPVKSLATADADGVPAVTAAAAGDTLRGILVNFLPDYDNLYSKHRAASTERYCFVIDDPEALFAAQEDSDASTLAITDIGVGMLDFAGTGGSTVTGHSSAELDSSNVGTTNGQFRLIRLLRNPKNAVGDNAEYEVVINEHELN